MEPLEQAYDSAVTVLTVECSFVEWAVLRVDSPLPDPESSDWSPLSVRIKFGDDTYASDPTQKIEGKRWIYVFARPASVPGLPMLVEEIELSKGHMRAAKMGPRKYPAEKVDGPKSPLAEETRHWEDVGTTIRFARRWRGWRMVHYFFASRIPLSRAAVERLRNQVDRWAPPVTFGNDVPLPKLNVEGEEKPFLHFGEWDPNVVTGQGPGVLQVPVLDPLTIALNLNELATSATKDLLDFWVPHDGQDDATREKVKKRHDKVALAGMVQLVLKSAADGSELGPHREVARRSREFLEELEEVFRYRIDQQEKWWKYLANWLSAEPIHFLARAHLEHAKRAVSLAPVQGATEWTLFFVPFVLCLVGANAAPAGRGLVDEIVRDRKRWHWFHGEVLPEQAEPKSTAAEQADAYQIPRRISLAVLEGLAVVAARLPPKMIREVLHHQGQRMGVTFDFRKGQLTSEPPMASMSGTLEEHWHDAALHHRKHAILKATMLVEVIDLAMSFRQFLEDRSPDKALGLAGSVSGTTALFWEFMLGEGKRFSKVARASLGLLGGVIDTFLGAREMWNAAKEGDSGAATVALIKTSGSGIFTLGLVARLFAVEAEAPVATPVVVVGLLLTVVGYVVSLLIHHDTPIDKFLKHCAFAEDGGGGGGQLVDQLPEMQAGDYKGQLWTLMNLLCDFQMDIEPYDRLGGPDPWNRIRFKMGWIPALSYLDIEEEDVFGWPGAEQGKAKEVKGEHAVTKTRFSFGEQGKITKREVLKGPGDQGVQLDKVEGEEGLFVSHPVHPSPAEATMRRRIYGAYYYKVRCVAALYVGVGKHSFAIPPGARAMRVLATPTPQVDFMSRTWTE
jgi:hypothetical protein